jgi:hypothetical protein
MRIDELNEFQGVTPQLVTDWLLANGWTQTKPGWWERGEDGFLFDSQTFDQQWFWVHALVAVYECCGVQALLRMINPRMRKGWPSDEAIAAADSWIAKHPKGVIIVGEMLDDPERGPGLAASLTTRLDKSRSDGWCFWPCDEHGNKVRWPTDAEGNML